MMGRLALFAAATALSAAIAAWLGTGPARAGVLGRPVDDTAPMVDLPLAFVVELLSIAVRQGASIPRALAVVGARSGPGLGALMMRVASRLEEGSDWESAWSLAGRAVRACGEPSVRPWRGRPDFADADRGGTVMRDADMLREALEPSWRHGSSPLLRLQAFADQLNAEQRDRIERQSAALAVKVLLPCGLCFLPSFVLIGIVPVVAAFA